MEPLLGTATLAANGHARYDATPVLLLVGAILVVRFVFGFRLTWPVVGTTLMAGVALGWAVDVWGATLPIAVAFLLGAVISWPVRRHQARPATG